MFSFEFNLMYLGCFIIIAFPFSMIALFISGFQMKGKRVIYGVALSLFLSIIIGVISNLLGIIVEMLITSDFPDLPLQILNIGIKRWISFAIVAGVVYVIVILQGITSKKGKGVPKWDDILGNREKTEKRPEFKKDEVQLEEPYESGPEGESEDEVFNRRLKQAEDEAERKIKKQEIKNIIVEKAQRAPLILEKGFIKKEEKNTPQSLLKAEEKKFDEKKPEEKKPDVFVRKGEPRGFVKKEQVFVEKEERKDFPFIKKEENKEESKMNVDDEKQRILERIKQKLKEAQSGDQAAKKIETKFPESSPNGEDVKKALQAELKSLIQKKEPVKEEFGEEGRIVESEEQRESSSQELLPSLEELEVPAKKFKAAAIIKKEEPKKKGLFGMFKK